MFITYDRGRRVEPLGGWQGKQQSVDDSRIGHGSAAPSKRH